MTVTPKHHLITLVHLRSHVDLSVVRSSNNKKQGLKISKKKKKRIRDLAAASRPRSGSYRAHLGLGGPTVERVCGETSGSQGSGDERLGAGGVVANPLQHGRLGLADTFRAWLGQGWPGMPCCRVWSVAAAVLEAWASCTPAVEVELLPLGFGATAPSFGEALRSPSPRVGVRSETAWMVAQPCWRMALGGGLDSKLGVI